MTDSGFLGEREGSVPNVDTVGDPLPIALERKRVHCTDCVFLKVLPNKMEYWWEVAQCVKGNIMLENGETRKFKTQFYMADKEKWIGTRYMDSLFRICGDYQTMTV